MTAGALMFYKGLDRQKAENAHLQAEAVRLRERADALDSDRERLKGELESARSESARIAAERSALQVEKERLEERQRLLADEADRRQADAEARFRNMANEILAANTDTFRRQNEARLGEILTPLKDDIASFRKSVSDAYQAEARERFSLGERIKELIAANATIGREARELTEALRGDSKVQGDWGELVLETILEKSGLQEGVHFTVQQTRDSAGHALRNDDGALLRPDVVIQYPGERCMVVDSKVSLTAFVRATQADTDEERTRHERAHVASVRAHIAELAGKNYQDYVGSNTADFVMMFIPSEPAYIAAMRLDPTLWQEAYDRRVVIVSPTHLVSALKLVAQLWRHDSQTRNAVEIATQAGRMYDKFVAFVDDMAKIEKGINAASSAHTEAMRKLREGTGNLIKRAEDLRTLGAKATKTLAKK